MSKEEEASSSSFPSSPGSPVLEAAMGRRFRWWRLGRVIDRKRFEHAGTLAAAAAADPAVPGRSGAGARGREGAPPSRISRASYSRVRDRKKERKADKEVNGKLSLDSQFEEAASFEEEEKRLDMSPPLSPPPSLRLSPLFDAHCHLQDRRLGEEKQGGESEEQRRHRRLDDIVARARSAGVAGVACCACSEDDWHEVAALADRYPGFVHPSFGLHPWYLEGRRPGWGARLEALLRSRPGAGVGESGLDRAKTSKRKLPPLDVQLEALREHARIARELRRPLTVHCVRAAGALHDALSPFAPFSRRQDFSDSSSCSSSSSSSPSPSAASAPLENTCLVIHGWQGPREEVLRLGRLGSGVFFSLGARSLPPKKKEEEGEEGQGQGEETASSSAAAAAASGSLSYIPLSRLLIETDSPDGFEPRCLGEGVEVFFEEEGGIEGEEKEEQNEEEAVNVLSGSIKLGLGLAETKKERNRKQQANSKHGTAAKSKKLNQPANVAALLPELARALGKGESEVARACWENSRSVFCGRESGGGGE